MTDAAHFHHQLKIRWERRLKEHWLLRPRVNEAQFPGVEHLPGSAAFFSIKRIADNRVTEMAQVNPNLVGAPAVQCTFHQTDSATGLHDPIFRFGGPSAT